MLNCKQVFKIIGSDELEGSGPGKRIAVWFHLLICKHCRRYRDQIGGIGDLTRHIYNKRSTGGNRGR